MISAIAARKAAQAAQQRQTQQPSQSSSERSPPRPSKRKPSPQNTKPPLKKRKRNANKSTKSSTYPVPSLGSSKSQDDVIIIDSDDDSDSAESEASSLSEESDVEFLEALPPHLRDPAWSPSMPLHDSPSEEDDGSDASSLLDLPPRFRLKEEAKVGTALSTFTPISGENIFFLSTSEVQKLGLDFKEEAKSTLVALDEGDRMCLLGTCRITVLRGSISVNGAILCPSTTPHNIFAPRSSPLPVIEYSTRSTKALIDTAYLPQSLQSHDSTKFSIFLLQEFRTNVEALGRVCRIFEGVYEPPHPRREDDSTTSPFCINGLHLVNKHTRDLNPFEMPPSWDASLAKISIPPSVPSNPIFLVKGPKNSGKSTFARTLLNILLGHYRRVAFLDCDPGQSEFTPGGFVSLNVVTQPVFGPPYTHPTLPFRAHFIGATTPKASPSAYLDEVRDLIDAWRVDVMHLSMPDDVDGDEKEADTIPLVVNTMGWSKGLGADLMQKIEEIIEPGHVFGFEVDDSLSYSKPPEFPSQHHIAQTYVLEPAPISVLSMNHAPADHRTLSILSYFHAIFPPLPGQELGFNQLMAQTWDTTLPLCAIQPYEVNVHTAFDQIVLSGAGSEDVVPDELSRVLNGALVGFVRLNHQLPFNTNSRTDSPNAMTPYIQCRQPPSPSESHCVGLGLIRGVSFPPTSTEDSGSPATLHVLTPVPPALLTGARVLVKGEMELPIWGMLDFRQFNNSGDTGTVAGVEKDRVPYLRWGRGSEGAIGAEKRRIRRNLMRRGQA